MEQKLLKYETKNCLNAEKNCLIAEQKLLKCGTETNAEQNWLKCGKDLTKVLTSFWTLFTQNSLQNPDIFKRSRRNTTCYTTWRPK